jgi:putative transposase
LTLPLFQGRYRAILVEKDLYALELSRYIHLNPMRAGILKDPFQYPWSSYSSYCSKKNKWDWLQRGFILAQISKKLGRAIRGYRDYVQKGMIGKQEDPLKKAIASTVIGSEQFTEWVREKWIKQGVDREVPALRAMGKKPDISFIKGVCEKVFREDGLESRRMALYLSHHISGQSLKEVGHYFDGISISAVSQNSLRQEKRFKDNPELLKTMLKLRETILS